MRSCDSLSSVGLLRHEAEALLPVLMFQLTIHYGLRATHLEKMRWALQMQTSLLKINESKLCNFHCYFSSRIQTNIQISAKEHFLVAKVKTSTMSSVEEKQ